MSELSPALPDGVRFYPGAFDTAAQINLLEAIRNVVKAAPLFTPIMPKTGVAMSVRMTNCGELGWVTDKQNGYRYQSTHPVTGKLWPAMPDQLIALWQQLSDYTALPEACLINFYDEQIGRAHV